MNTEHSLSALIMQKLNENGGEFTLTDVVDIATQNAEYVVAHYFARLEGRVAGQLQYAQERFDQAAGPAGSSIKDQSASAYDFYNGAIQALNAVIDDIGEIRRS